MNSTDINNGLDLAVDTGEVAKIPEMPSQGKKIKKKKVKPPRTQKSLLGRFSKNIKALSDDEDEFEATGVAMPNKKVRIKKQPPKKSSEFKLARKKANPHNLFVKVGRFFAAVFKSVKTGTVSLLTQMGVIKDATKQATDVKTKRGLKGRITIAVIMAVIISSVCLSVTGLILTYNTALSTLEATMTETAKVAASRTEKELMAYTNIAFETGCNERMSTNDLAAQAKKAMMAVRIKHHEFEEGDILDKQGKSIFSGEDLSNEIYFQTASKGEATVSDAFFDKSKNVWEITIASPLWSNGRPRTSVTGVITFVPNADTLKNIVTPIKVGKTGRAYILNGNGDIIAAPEGDVIAPTLEAIDKSETGFVSFKDNGKTYISAASKIATLNNWTVVIVAEQQEFMKQFTSAITIMLSMVLLFLVVFTAVAFIVGERISYPIKLCVDRLTKLSEGDFSSPVPQIKTGDETQVLATATADVTSKLRSVIDDTSKTLTEMADGNFNVSFDAEYHGGLAPIKIAGDKILHSLNLTLNKIHTVSSEVALGSKQVSIGAQILSDGATVQADSIRVLAEKMSSIEIESKQSSSRAQTAREKSQETNKIVFESNKQMFKLTEAMNEIRRTSFDIGGVIKTIDDIAFQTNILALNAAVEAARAGADGKGFAVVADEIRRLAEKSSTAAEETLDLIQNSIIAVKTGNAVASETAKQLKAVTIETTEVVKLIEEISKSCTNQSDEIAEVSSSIDSITTVVQSNSATSEESAATSEELSSQAVLLKDLLEKFDLHEVAELAQAPKSAAADLAYFSVIPFSGSDEELQDAIKKADVNFDMSLELDAVATEQTGKSVQKVRSRASKYDEETKTATPEKPIKEKKPTPKKAPAKTQGATKKSAPKETADKKTEPKKSKPAPKKSEKTENT